MDWQAIGAVGEVLGSVAVLVTLVYVAAQVRQARAEVGRALNLGRFDAARELAMNYANNVELAASAHQQNLALGGGAIPFVSRLTAQTVASVEEALALHWSYLAWTMFRVRVISYVDDLPDVEQADFNRVVRFEYGESAIGRLWWESQKSTLAPRVTQYIDRVLAQPE